MISMAPVYPSDTTRTRAGSNRNSTTWNATIRIRREASAGEVSIAIRGEARWLRRSNHATARTRRESARRRRRRDATRRARRDQTRRRNPRRRSRGRRRRGVSRHHGSHKLLPFDPAVGAVGAVDRPQILWRPPGVERVEQMDWRLLAAADAHLLEPRAREISKRAPGVSAAVSHADSSVARCSQWSRALQAVVHRHRAKTRRARVQIREVQRACSASPSSTRRLQPRRLQPRRLQPRRLQPRRLQQPRRLSLPFPSPMCVVPSRRGGSRRRRLAPRPLSETRPTSRTFCSAPTPA